MSAGAARSGAAGPDGAQPREPVAAGSDVRGSGMRPSARSWTRGFRAKLAAGYATAILVLLVGFATVFQSIAAERAIARAESARRVVRTAREVQLHLLDAETGERGYLLTGEERYLTPYRVSVPAAESSLRDLATLVQDDPDLRPRVDELADTVHLELNELAATLRAPPAGTDPKAVLRDDTGSRLMDRIRNEVAGITDAADMARARDDREGRGARLVGRWLTGAGNVGAFLLAVAVTAWSAKAFQDLHEAHERLGAFTDKLAAQERKTEEQLEHQRRLTAALGETNDALLRSNADLEQFAYVASHDLKAPLRGIASVADWLEDDLGALLTPELKKHLDALRGRMHRLEALITGIVTYSRAGRGSTPAEQVDPAVLLADIADVLALPANVRVTVKRPMPALVTPRAPLQQVFLNLLSNAAKHGSPSGGEIVVTAEEAGDLVRFSVRDHGPGIAQRYHDRIFGLFRTLAPRDRVEGAGIGLAVVKKLLARHGGSISVDSAPEKGATFIFTWPRRMKEG